jgi:hypothetical protein
VKFEVTAAKSPVKVSPIASCSTAMRRGISDAIYGLGWIKQRRRMRYQFDILDIPVYSLFPASLSFLFRIALMSETDDQIMGGEVGFWMMIATYR